MLRPSAATAAIKVLIVDDDVEICELAKTALARAGCRVMTASDGSVALGIMDLERFDAIVTDVKMARMSGVEFLTNAVKDPRNQGTRFFVLSGHIKPETRAAILTVSNVEVLEKPFDPAQLAATIVQALRPPERLAGRFEEAVLMQVSVALYQELSGAFKGDIIVDEPQPVTAIAPSYVTAFAPMVRGEAFGTLVLVGSRLFVTALNRGAAGENAPPPDPEHALRLVDGLMAALATRVADGLAALERPWRVGPVHTVVGEHLRLSQRDEMPLIAYPLRSPLFPAHTQIMLSETVLATPAEAPANDTEDQGHFRLREG